MAVGTRGATTDNGGGKGESLAENQIGLRKCEMAENQKMKKRKNRVSASSSEMWTTNS